MPDSASYNGSIKSKSKPPKPSRVVSNSKPPAVSGQLLKPSKRPSSSRSGGLISGLLGISARLLTWYAILTVLFRCPASLEECSPEISPAICAPYFQLKHIVVPHVEPYYNAYAGPYVQAVQPYYETVDRAVLTPTWGYAKKYGTPAVIKAQELGQAQWERTVQPQLVKVQGLARAKYDQSLAPHVDRAATTVGPYYEIARTNALQTYHEVLRPTYDFVQPYALQGYAVASAFTADTVVPSAVWAWNKTYLFLDGTVWPQLRVLYTETVEPQLVKIGKRLGRYNGTGAAQKPASDTVKTIASKATSSFTKPTASATPASPSSSAYSAPPIVSSASEAVMSAASAISSSISSVVKPESTPQSKFSDDKEPVVAPEPDADEEEKRRVARETVAEDLKAWQEKYTKAADEGAAEIQERVDEISKQMVAREIQVRGEGLLAELQQSVVSELVTLRRRIIEVVGSVQKGAATPEQAEAQIANVVRSAGLEVKQRATAVRSWHEQFDDDVRTQVTAAADSHFEILGSIRDLALQKIGMKWAWMDGVTYKDWAKYHLLKSRFDEWEQDLEKLVVSHPGLVECQNEGQAIEDRAMELAASAAKELARIKQVAAWKLAAMDDSKDFDSETTKAAFETAQKLKSEAAAQPQTPVEEDLPEEMDEQADPEAPQDVEWDTDISEPAEKVMEKEASISTETSPTPETDSGDASSAETTPMTLENLVSSLSSAFASASDKLSSISESSKTETPSLSSTGGFSAYVESETETPRSSPEPLASMESVAGVPEVVANASEPTEPDSGDAEKPVPVQIPADDFEAQLPDEDDEDDAESADLTEEDSKPAPSETVVKPALFGAAAQSVPSRRPIMDDDTVESLKQAGADIPATLSSVASSAYSVAMSRASVQYDSAISLISANMQGTPLPMHSSLLSSVSVAYSNAVESARVRLNDAVQSAESIYGAASAKVAPTPTPTPYVDWAAIEAIAAERLQQGRVWAEEQYESAKVAIGLATPTPTSPVERLMQNAQHNYYAGLGVAQARYTEFLNAASSAYSSLTATPTPTDLAGTVSSVASVASESAASAAGVAGENASAAYSAASASAAAAASVFGENVSSVAAAGYDNASAAFDAAGSAVSANWEAVVSQLSSRVYGAPTPTPWYESLYSAVGEYAAAATDAVGGGASTVGDAANQAASTASAEAAKQYAVVSSIVSELLVGKEPTFSESIVSRLSAAYAEATVTAKAAGDKVASVASEATEAVKSATEHVRDEL